MTDETHAAKRTSGIERRYESEKLQRCPARHLFTAEKFRYSTVV